MARKWTTYLNRPVEMSWSRIGDVRKGCGRRMGHARSTSYRLGEGLAEVEGCGMIAWAAKVISASLMDELNSIVFSMIVCQDTRITEEGIPEARSEK